MMTRLCGHNTTPKAEPYAPVLFGIIGEGRHMMTNQPGVGKISSALGPDMLILLLKISGMGWKAVFIIKGMKLTMTGIVK